MAGEKGKDSILKVLGNGAAELDTIGLAVAIEKGKENIQPEEFPEGPRGSAIPNDEETIGAERSEQLEEATKQIFTPAKVRNIIRAPFELWFLKTGCEGVRLKKEEADLLVEDLVDVLNEFVKVNPIWLAVFGLSINGSMIFMNKMEALNQFNALKKKAA
jgi:hypothetical protein